MALKTRVRSLHLHRYVPWRTRSVPLDWSAEFGRQAPLKLEIGFGNGEYLARSAEAEPETNFIGVEMTWGSIKRASAICQRRGLDNVRLLWEDVRTALYWDLSNAEESKGLAAITALYPCPWPKRRHEKFRLFQPPFITLCNSRLIPGGTLTVVTDSAAYRDQMLAENDPSQTGMELELEIIPATFATKYEKKWQEEGQSDFFRLTYTKISHREVINPEVQIVKHHVAKQFDPKSFSPKDEKDPFSIQFKQFIFDQDQQIGLLEVYTREETIEQHFYIRIKQQDNGWKIHPAGGPPLLPVPSVQRALDIVKETAEAQLSSKN